MSTKTKRTTLKQAKAILTPLGITINKKDGEYRVGHKDGRPNSGYFTDDIDDAVNSGRMTAALLSAVKTPIETAANS